MPNKKHINKTYRVENCEECNAINRHKGRHKQREYDTTLNNFCGQPQNRQSLFVKPIAGPLAQPFAEVAIGFYFNKFEGMKGD